MCCLIYEHTSYAKPKCDAGDAAKRPSPAAEPGPPPDPDDPEEMSAQPTGDEEGTP
jgi:hypothetical protein